MRPLYICKIEEVGSDLPGEEHKHIVGDVVWPPPDIPGEWVTPPPGPGDPRRGRAAGKLLMVGGGGSGTLGPMEPMGPMDSIGSMGPIVQ